MPSFQRRAANPEQWYRQVTSRSRQAARRAQGAIPGGTGSGLGNLRPYPTYVRRAEGCYLYDVDGRHLLDFYNGGYALPLGHNHPKIREDVAAQLREGTLFGAPTELEYTVAHMLQERMPSLERLRFTASGTEAVMFAIRLARAFTGRKKIAKIWGGYHGTHDSVEVGTGRNRSIRKDATPGLMSGASGSVVLLPFNAAKECQRRIEAHSQSLAAVIVEPVLGSGGMVPPQEGFLEVLRDVTQRKGILLIFDEMVTFPLAPGGAQELFDVRPDLTTLGKALGGGMPIGVFGGQADVMALVDPGASGRASIGHISTFAAHPLSLAAATAFLEAMTPQTYRKLHTLGKKVQHGLERLAARRSVPLQVSGVGHLFAYHWTRRPMVDFASAQTSDLEVIRDLNLRLLSKGFYVPWRGRCCVSAAMTSEDIARFLQGMDEALVESGLAGGY
jgi:glutamate-1-semialdehyde 2,1-aminomutase